MVDLNFLEPQTSQEKFLGMRGVTLMGISNRPVSFPTSGAMYCFGACLEDGQKKGSGNSDFKTTDVSRLKLIVEIYRVTHQVVLYALAMCHPVELSNFDSKLKL